MNKKPADIAAKLGRAAEVMPAADALRFFNQLLEVRKEQLVTTREMAKISTARDVALAEITAKYTLLHKVFDRVFEERSDAIDKHFQIIDRGLQHNDRELVLGGLRGLSDIVASSPFGNVEQLGKLLESGTKIEL